MPQPYRRSSPAGPPEPRRSSHARSAVDVYRTVGLAFSFPNLVECGRWQWRTIHPPGQPGPARPRPAEPDPPGRRQPRLRPVRQLLDRAGPRLASRAGPARGLAGDRDRLPGGDRRPGAGDRAARRRAAPARQGRSAGQGAADAPRRWEFTALVMVAEIGHISRFPSARKLAAWAGLTPTVRVQT